MNKGNSIAVGLGDGLLTTAIVPTGLSSPAICRLGGQDVRKEHLGQLAEVEELIPAAAESYVEVRAVLLQGGLLKIISALHCRGEDASRGFLTRFVTNETPR